MATAGKVMPRPRGNYDPKAIYEIIDMVSYQNVLWICKKSNTYGVEPSLANYDTWMFATDGAGERISETDIDRIEPITGDGSSGGGGGGTDPTGGTITTDEIDSIVNGVTGSITA